jgi:hypothetical protein
MAYNANYSNVWCPARPQSSYPNYYYIIEVAVREESTNVDTNKSRLYLEADITGHEISFSGSDNQYLEVYWWDSKNGEILGATTTITSINKNETKQITGYIDVEHNSDGTLSGKAYTIWGKNGTNSFVPPETGASVTVEAPLTLTTIPRASVPSITGTPNIGSQITINTNRKSTNFIHTLTYTFGSLSGTIATNVGEKYENWTIPTSFYGQIPNATSGTMTITCTTYNGSTSVGSEAISVTVYVNTSTAKPTLNTPTFTIDSVTNGKTGSTSKYINNFSTASFTCTATNSYNSPIRSVSLIGVKSGVETPIETKTYTGSNTSQTATFSNKTKLTYDSFRIRAVDARNIQSNNANVGITTIAYVPITSDSSPTIVRTTQTGSQAKITSFNGNFWQGNFGAVTNALTIQWRYRVSGGSYSSLYTIPAGSITKSGNTYSTSVLFTYTNLYDIEFTVKDSLQTAPLVTYRLSRGVPNFVIFQNKVQRNGNDVVAKSDLLNLIYPVGSIYMSINSTNPNTLFGGTWQRLPKGKFLYNINSDSASWGDGNSTGTTTNSHTLTVDQIPEHNHGISSKFTGWTSSNAPVQWVGSGQGYQVTDGAKQGGGQGHSHNIPYISVYMWRRTA